MTKKIVVCGAGVIGATVAYLAKKDGYNVVLIEQDKPCAGASFGNAGIISNYPVHPYTSPTILKRLPKLLVTKSPAGFSLRLGLSLIPLGINFIRASLFKHPENMKKLAFITSNALTGYERIFSNKNIYKSVHKKGFLVVFYSLSDRLSAISEMNDRMKFGVNAIEWSKAKTLQANPDLSNDVQGAIFYPNALYLKNPTDFVHTIVDEFKKLGGEYVNATISHLDSNKKSATANLENGETITADSIVMAFGHNNRDIAKKLGKAIPIYPERGYHYTTKKPMKITIPMKEISTGLHLTPMADGLRVVSGADYAPMHAPIIKRIQNFMIDSYKKCMGDDLVIGDFWFGARPSTPDSLPIFEILDTHKRIYMPGGHGHFGITMAGFTAEETLKAIKNKKFDETLSKYSAKRFVFF